MEAWEQIPQRASGRTWSSTAWIPSSELHFRISKCGTVGLICSVSKLQDCSGLLEQQQEVNILLGRATSRSQVLWVGFSLKLLFLLMMPFGVDFCLLFQIKSVSCDSSATVCHWLLCPRQVSLAPEGLGSCLTQKFVGTVIWHLLLVISFSWSVESLVDCSATERFVWLSFQITLH